MSLKTADINNEYKKNKDLKKEDVQIVKEWAEKQPHLPQMTELQIILFLQSCYSKIELAKVTIDTFYTTKTHCPEFFKNRDPTTSPVTENLNVALITILPKPTHDNYRVIFCKLVDTDVSKFTFSELVKIFDMMMMITLMQEGTMEGLVIIMDLDSFSFSHFLRLGINNIRRFLFYLQDALPVRLKGLHFINIVSFMDKLLAVIKPFMKKELLDVLHLHPESFASIHEFVPQKCLPSDYGGEVGTISELHESSIKKIRDHADFFREDEKLIADESKRSSKRRDLDDIFGTEGSFKKLDID